MCGIAGIISFKNKVSPDKLNLMNSSLAHRGRDAQKTYLNNNKTCGLTHRRLSIIDLTENANQPMSSECGNYKLVFNGEIYNYEDLRAELKEAGRTFRTSSDSEVVLQAFIHWGSDCVDRFNGMFAFAIWDEEKTSLSIFRDRIGIKPLYYIRNESMFAFASEIKALRHLVDEKRLNSTAIHHFFRLGYIPEPYTIYQEIHKFPKGSSGLYSEQGFKINTFWNLHDKTTPEIEKDFETAKEKYHSLLKKSVELRLKSDVPFGIFLSGGVDSSIVAAVAQSQYKEKIKTFSIGFKEAQFNESKWAKNVAHHLKTDHHEYILSEKDAMELVRKIPTWYDEPYGDASAIPTYLVSKMAGEKVKMVLTGDGGDEQFMGYGMYDWAKRLSKPILRNFKKPISGALKLSGKDKLKRASEYFRFNEHKNIEAHIFSVDQYLFSEREINACFNFKEGFEELKVSSVNRNLSPSEKQALFDLNYYLPDDLLTKVDRVTMQNGVEARVPLLDHNLIEYTINLDESLKVRNGVSKHLLKEVLYEYLPKELFDRPKWGFGIPLNKWLSNELKPLLDEYVNENRLSAFDFYNVKKLMEIKKRYLAGEEYLYNKLWLVIVFNMWAEQIE